MPTLAQTLRAEAALIDDWREAQALRRHARELERRNAHIALLALFNSDGGQFA